MDKNWSAQQIPRLDGKRAIVTGANSGIGLHTALELARAGADVVIAVRDPARGAEAKTQILAQAPSAKVSVETLDLAALASVQAFAERMLAERRPLDLLVNNAGVMAIPTREQTADGFERQFGTNHLGHFALTGALAAAVARRQDAARGHRVEQRRPVGQARPRRTCRARSATRPWAPTVNRSWRTSCSCSSCSARGSRSASPASPRIRAPPSPTCSVTASTTGWSRSSARPADRGALPSLYAAVGEVHGGEFFGPRDRFGMVGPPKLGAAAQARARRDAGATAVAALGGADRRRLRARARGRVGEPRELGDEGHSLRRHRHGRAGRLARVPARREVTSVLAVGRSASGQSNAKLRELVHRTSRFLDGRASQLAGYDACFFCLGVSSAGMIGDRLPARHLRHDARRGAHARRAQPGHDLHLRLGQRHRLDRERAQHVGARQGPDRERAVEAAVSSASTCSAAASSDRCTA